MRITCPGVRHLARLAALLVLPGVVLSAPGDSSSGVARADDENRAARVEAAATSRQAAEAQERRLQAVEKTVKTFEDRLGRAVHPPTLSRTVERRLQDVEKRLDTIERSLKAMDALERKVKQLENQIRRVESRR
jgi:DNA repair exonuclease SbcCD ATPase subunit